MKNILLTLSVLALILFTACGDDDGDDNGGDTMELGLSGTVNYNGEEYAIANGLFRLNLIAGDAVGEFYLVDGTIEATSSDQVSASNSQIVIVMTAESNDSSTLEDGDYATSTDIPDLTVDLAVTTFDDGNQVRREAFTNGTVNIQGSDNTYTVTFNAPFGQGITLTGTVSGTYDDI
ncbi:MAG: hypothetical protein AAFY41_09660 [Bacteroidota bacterium]